MANGVRHFKKEGGRAIVCQAVEEYAKEYAKEYVNKVAIKTAIEAGIEYKIEKDLILENVCKKFGIDRAETEKIYDACTG